MDIAVLLAVQAWRSLNRASDSQKLRRQNALNKAVNKLNFQQREEFKKCQEEGTP